MNFPSRLIENAVSEFDKLPGGGHTEFHQVFIIEAGNEKYFYGGDVVPQGSQLQRKFIAKYDFNGKRSEELHREYGHRAATENWICLFFYSTEMPMARVKETDGRFELIKVQSN